VTVQRFNRARLRHRLSGPVQIVLDVSAWTVAATLAIYLRFGLDIADAERRGLLKAIPLMAGIQLIAGLSVGLYRSRWRYGSFDEVSALIFAAMITTGSFYALNEYYFQSRPIPQSVTLVAGILGLVLMAGVRYVYRLLKERRQRPDSDTATKLIVFGAGAGGIRVLTSLLQVKAGQYLPVAILDDDPARARRSIRGVSVLGTRHDMASVAQRTGATTLLIAVPSASARLMSELVELAQVADLDVKVLPPVDELVTSNDVGGVIRDINESDLLGRHQVVTNVDEIAGYLTGKRVLVTGAGGSIGSELCRQIMRYNPEELMMLDRDESALHQVQLSIEGQALLDSPNTLLCDIRDAPALNDLFGTRCPEVVFHAAALKHLPLLERFPIEAYKSNMIGTLNVLQAASLAGAERFVNVSTDKAANPISVLGYSKRVAERLTAHAASVSTNGVFLSVRFGNVLNSRGSVLSTFNEQIEHGGPVTVTDRHVTRFFMTIPEAVQLTIQAGAIGRPGEVLVLDMGEAVSIYDVAERLIARSGKVITIKITGLRDGEKLHEDLFGDGEKDERPMHSLIAQTPVPALDPCHLELSFGDEQEVRQKMVEWCFVDL
jgi:FlaA1/EpsC-like NDP-sugar epimerase